MAGYTYWVSGQTEHLQGQKKDLNFDLLTWHPGAGAAPSWAWKFLIFILRRICPFSNF